MDIDWQNRQFAINRAKRIQQRRSGGISGFVMRTGLAGSHRGAQFIMAAITIAAFTATLVIIANAGGVNVQTVVPGDPLHYPRS